MRGWGNRRRAEAHEKSMGSYELFAWRDAMAAAEFVKETFGMAKAQREYEAADPQEVIRFEQKNSEFIADFIQKSESQRPAYFKRVTKNLDLRWQVVFAVLAVLGLVRAKEILELRDNFRMVLAPGRGNRVTAAGVYAFSNELFSVMTYRWPAEVFEAMGEYGYDDGEDDDSDL